MSGIEGFHGAKPEKKAATILPTEDVLNDFSDTHEHFKDHVGTPEEKIVAFQALHSSLEHFENQEMTALYDEGRVPTFQSLEEAAAIASTVLVSDPDPEAQRIGKLLSERMNLVKRWARRYVASILRFRTSKLAMMRMNESEQREAFVQADADRRRIHDSLLEALESLSSFIEKGKEYADYTMPIVWSPSDELAPGTTWHNGAIFSKKALSDRDLIRDWAIVADRVEEIRKLTGYPPGP
jgi:hypothetical protein